MSGAVEEWVGLYGLVEWAVLAAVLLLVAWRPRPALQVTAALEGRLEPLVATCTRYPAFAVLLLGLLAIALRAAVLPWLGAPVPSIHDEQSLLLQAQTYMAGRLANPMHPFWEHFESFHINQVPAYASMYFPGRGLPLALGLWLAQEPWLGVWLSMTLMCMAVVWMLQAWVSAPLALLGGLIVVLRFGVFSYWVNSYWGGAFTALGALLVVGALPRILRAQAWQTRLWLGMVMGLGALILMTIRPYEGFLICLPVALALLVAWGRQAWQGMALSGLRYLRQAALPVVLPVALPVLLLTSAGAAMLLAYNQATTGLLAKTPYELNRQTYANAPAFLTSPPIQSAQRGPAYFRDFYAAEAKPYERRNSLRGLLAGAVGKIYHTWNFYLGPLLTLPFLVGLWHTRKDLFVLGGLALFAAGYALETWNFPHYTAPLMPLLLIVLLRGFAGLHRAGGRGLLLSHALPWAVAAMLLLPLAAVISEQPKMAGNTHSRACCAIEDTNLRKQIQNQLLALPGQDLVLIKDGPNNPLHFELVYNEADIDSAAIVWARRLSPRQDAALQAYFSERQQWGFEWRPDLPSGYKLSLIKNQAQTPTPHEPHEPPERPARTH